MIARRYPLLSNTPTVEVRFARDALLGEQDSNPRSRGLTPTYRMLMRPEVGSASYPSGEAAQGPATAIANALADAAGVRVREVPLTAQRVKAAIGI